MPLTQSQQITGFTARALSGAATTQSPAVQCGGAVNYVAVAVSLTGLTGGGGVTFSLQWSQDGGATWCTADAADTFTALSATGNVVKQFPLKGHLFRLNEVLTGTSPTATYTVTALLG